MVGRLELVGVLVGVAATALAFWLLFFVGSSVIFPNPYPEGAMPVDRARYVQVVLDALLLLVPLLLTFFLGGLAAGMMVSAFPGQHGGLVTALTSFGGFAWFVRPLLPLLWEPGGQHGEVYVLNEGLGTLIVLSATFCGLLPFVVIAGYAGGRVGGRLRNGLQRRAVRTSAD